MRGCHGGRRHDGGPRRVCAVHGATGRESWRQVGCRCGGTAGRQVPPPQYRCATIEWSCRITEPPVALPVDRARARRRGGVREWCVRERDARDDDGHVHDAAHRRIAVVAARGVTRCRRQRRVRVRVRVRVQAPVPGNGADRAGAAPTTTSPATDDTTPDDSPVVTALGPGVLEGVDWQVFDDRIAPPLISSGAIAVSIAVAKDGRLVHEAAYGVADPATGEPVTTASRFRIASISKVLTVDGGAPTRRRRFARARCARAGPAGGAVRGPTRPTRAWSR